MGNHKKCFFLLNEKNKAPHTHQDSEYKSEYRSQLKNSLKIFNVTKKLELILVDICSEINQL